MSPSVQFIISRHLIFLSECCLQLAGHACVDKGIEATEDYVLQIADELLHVRGTETKIVAAASTQVNQKDTNSATDISYPTEQSLRQTEARKKEEEGLEQTLVWLNSTVRGWMRELGIDGLEKLSRRNLRALDYDTASISGLRLIGYDRPLPMWLGN